MKQIHGPQLDFDEEGSVKTYRYTCYCGDWEGEEFIGETELECDFAFASARATYNNHINSLGESQ